MATPRLFRQRALDRLATPDELDDLLQVVHLKAWIPLVTLAGLCVAALVWSIAGRIPVTVDGKGVLINPGNVKGLQSETSGQLVELHLHVGQELESGQVIGRFHQPALQTVASQAEAKRDELVAADAASDKLDALRRELEQQSNDAQRKRISQEITKLLAMAQAIVEKDKTYRAAQRRNLERTKSLSQQLHNSLEKHFQQVKQLKAEGLTAGPLVLSTERDFTESQLRLASIEVQLRELDLREIQGDEKFLEQQNRISDLQLQLKELDVKEQRLRQQILDANFIRENSISDVRRQIERLKFDLQRHTQLTSKYSGRVLEVAVSAGQRIDEGQRLGSVEVDDSNAKIKNVAYFEVGKGKRIRPGMEVRVTPATVERERHGAILGRVVSVSSFPITRQGATNLVGNEEVAAMLTRSGGMIEVVMELERDPHTFSGFHWTGQGPRSRFSAGTTTTVRVTVEQRRPITYLLPVLRTWVFGDKDEDLEPLRKK